MSNRVIKIPMSDEFLKNKKDNGWVEVPNVLIKELGIYDASMLCAAYNLPEKWVFNNNGFATRCKTGPDKTKSWKGRMQDKGYLIHHQVSDGKQFHHTWFVSLEPITEHNYPVVENPLSGDVPMVENPVEGNPVEGNPAEGNPAEGKPPLDRKNIDIKIKDTKILDKKNEDSMVSAESVQHFPPSKQDVEDYISEKGYVVKADTFCKYYEKRNWYAGKEKITDWKAKVDEWQDREWNKPINHQKETMPDYMKQDYQSESESISEEQDAKLRASIKEMQEQFAKQNERKQ